MRSENVADPVEAFRLLLRLDPVHPPPLDVAKYLPLVVALRTIFVYGGNETAVEVALGRAADLTGGLL
jgi:hypothetical protein